MYMEKRYSEVTKKQSFKKNMDTSVSSQDGDAGTTLSSKTAQVMKPAEML